ncbi:hypothetical protein COT44_03555 [Candidatus Shapirobacteria bacterium CG08_land_8_20_14_0_20_39_18]|uniref:DUF4190 domain-containing protein n=1 Tax=Candidatus Shapirobacteria bacterium CG08_land_8_20_14_0_20_39_18 TaxID=1974883 RepID=A0A2M6XCU0_9BACT|nr:MAG: hypothetical protein COT44_03555 [Candidatus Shapirobacteria bacterium CG08_land_8_20_14_0_20_39_18]PIY65137.1 MAG: hypothetical protein COY91_03665 [Candidatus Shapirobacteria bacterium CG_4_10_14_0_8_um_filter_39_15]PJE67994.1 MAG: hypothetical protein COU94_04100 [Candidatus Shapirobacteria bacterium CG10_big_fil_rev_8_21_14_0_10_38_8]
MLKKIIFLFIFLSLFISPNNIFAVNGNDCTAIYGICKTVCNPFGETNNGKMDCQAVARGPRFCCVPNSTSFHGISVPNFNPQFTSIGAIVSLLLPWIFGLAGIILLLMLIAGGFQLMVSAGDPKAAASAKGKLTGALIGFLIIFCAFWITQIMEKILGLSTGLF